MSKREQNFNPDQRSDNWRKARHGKFSASQIHRLLGLKGLGESGKTYALEKAIEEMYGDLEGDGGFVSFDMQRGIDLEPRVFDLFKEQYPSAEKCSFFVIDEHSGASPDGLEGDDAVIEIKCPKSEKFFKITSGALPMEKVYYAQMQMQMLATGRIKAYFVNYIRHDSQDYIHIQLVDRDEAMINLIQERIAEAVIIKNEHIEKLKQYEKSRTNE
jgi:exodeoxyribonuclease (lambda-induced)